MQTTARCDPKKPFFFTCVETLMCHEAHPEPSKSKMPPPDGPVDVEAMWELCFVTSLCRRRRKERESFVINSLHNYNVIMLHEGGRPQKESQ